jgi:ligand-binding SRPBCC domain-containing protein
MIYMHFKVSTLLECPVEVAWREALTPRLLRYVARPLQVFVPLQPAQWPEQWEAKRYLVSLRAFGLIPLGQQWIDISFPVADVTDNQQSYQIRDNGQGQLVRRWDHRITLKAVNEGVTLYTDTLEIDAGIITSLVWLYAQCFYRYRQARWRHLVKRHFQYDS